MVNAIVINFMFSVYIVLRRNDLSLKSFVTPGSLSTYTLLW